MKDIKTVTRFLKQHSYIRKYRIAGNFDGGNFDGFDA